MTNGKSPIPLVQRVRATEARLIERGGRRMPNGYLQPASAQALDDLVRSGYADSATAVIARAITEAHARRVKRTRVHPVQKVADPSGVKDGIPYKSA